MGAMGKSPGFVVLIMLAGCAGRSNDTAETREQQCERLRDQVVEIGVAGIPSSATPPAEDLARLGPAPRNGTPSKPDVEGHRAALKQALGQEYINSCLATLTPTQLECSLAARDTAALVACQQGTTAKEQP